LFRY